MSQFILGFVAGAFAMPLVHWILNHAVKLSEANDRAHGPHGGGS